jgi:tetratricopeptide (TPR) repeat protein
MKGEWTRQLHYQTRLERFRSLVMRVLLELNGLWRTSPRVRSSKSFGIRCFTFKRFRYKASTVSPPSLYWRIIATLRWTDWFILFGIVLILSAGAYERNSHWRSRMELSADCVRKAPRKERTHHNLGFAYYEEGQWDHAQKEFEEALRLDPHHTLSAYNLGLVHYRRGEMDRAIDCYKKAIDLNPGFPESYYNLGIAYYRKGRYRDAVQAYRKFLGMKPDYENGHNSLGLAYKKLRQRSKAVEAFEEEIRYYPENPHAHAYLGETYFEMRDYSRALVHLKRALLEPGLPDPEKIRERVLSIEVARGQKDSREKRWIR